MDVDSTSDPTSIIDLPEFCLDKILSNIELFYLVDIAEANSILARSASRVFKLHIGCKEVTVNRRGELSYIDKRYNENWTYGNLPLILKHFGKCINQLIIYFNANHMKYPNQNEHTLKAITQNCTSITELTVYLIPSDLILDHPFPNVTKLTYFFGIESAEIHDSWSDLNQSFPNLREFRCSTNFNLFPTFESSFISYHPHLKSFVYHGLKVNNWRNVGQFLNLNSQLNTVYLDGASVVIRQLQETVEWNSMNITNLRIHSSQGAFDVGFIGQLKKLKTLSIEGVSRYENIENVRSTELEEINLVHFDEDFDLELESIIIDFILKQKKLKKIEIQDLTSIGSIARELRQLTSISLIFKKRLEYTELGCEILEIMDNCRNIRSIHIKYDTSLTDHFKAFEMKLHSQKIQMLWQTTKNHLSRPFDGDELQIHRKYY